MQRWTVWALLSISLLFLTGWQAPPPVQLTAQEDQQRLIGLLHMDSVRRGADGRNPQAPNAANYDEAKANPYPKLPDPWL